MICKQNCITWICTRPTKAQLNKAHAGFECTSQFGSPPLKDSEGKVVEENSFGQRNTLEPEELVSIVIYPVGLKKIPKYLDVNLKGIKRNEYPTILKPENIW